MSDKQFDEKLTQQPTHGSDNVEGEVLDNVDHLHRRLGNRQIQLIAIGGSIGTVCDAIPLRNLKVMLTVTSLGSVREHQHRPVPRWARLALHRIHPLQYNARLREQLYCRNDNVHARVWRLHPSRWQMG